MKKVNPDELRPEYNRDDLGHGIRGKHYDHYKSGTNLVLLSPDVAAMFPDKPDKPEITNYKHQITNKFQITISKSQIRSNANCLKF